MIRALIIDTDSSARRRLQTQLALEPDLEIVGECAGPAGLVERIAATAPDVLFVDLDVERLPALQGALTGATGRAPYLVITAASDRQALRAFEVGVADYLLKPLELQRLRSAVMKIRRSVDRDLRMAQRTETAPVSSPRVSGAQVGHVGNRVPVKFGRRYRFMNMSAMHYVEARGDYTDIHMLTGEVVHSSDRISGIERRLPAERFLRVHRSFIINLEHVKEVRITDKDYQIVMQDERGFRPGSTYKTRVKKLLISGRRAAEPAPRDVDTQDSVRTV
jgi:two-component system LytT family response regulator